METLYIIIGILAIIFLWNIWNTHQTIKKLAEKKEDERILAQRLEILTQNINQNTQNSNQNTQSVTQNLNDVTKNLLTQLNQVNQLVSQRLKENTETTERTHRSIGERLDSAAKVVNAVTGRLAKMEEANQRIFEVGKDIASLQEILRAPKLRGVLGELFLGDLLAQILPKSHFTLQYAFKNGSMVDAVIHFPNDLIVPVDAKFPLENFKKILEEKPENEGKKAKKTFQNDIKKHIDDIASKYILPDEGTFDFALMYIPAENVYYETIVKNEEEEKSISAYAISKKVIPVSPNSFYIYLQAILMGFKGLQIEKNTKEILHSISNLKTYFGKFQNDFELVGTHLNRAKNSYDSSEKRLGNFGQKLEQIEMLESKEEPTLLEKN